MSRENVELVRRMYEAFHAGDAEGALAYFDPEVEVDASVRVDEGIGHGRDAVNAMVPRWLAAWDEWREEIEELRDLGNQVVVVSKQRGRAKGSGIEVETRYAVLYEIEATRSMARRSTQRLPRPSKPPGCPSRRLTVPPFGVARSHRDPPKEVNDEEEAIRWGDRPGAGRARSRLRHPRRCDALRE